MRHISGSLKESLSKILDLTNENVVSKVYISETTFK